MKTRFFTVFFAAAFVMTAQEPPAGQQMQSLKGVVRKNLAPVSKEVLKVKLPRPVERKLKNGLPVMIVESHRLPQVTIDLMIPATTLMDPLDLPGVADAVADMMMQGAGSRDAKQIADALSEIGASVNVLTEYGARATHVTASALTENLDPMLELMADILLRPTFPEDELKKWKTQQMGMLQQMRTSENFLAQERLGLLLYPNDGRRFSAPTPEGQAKITRQHLVDYHKAFYRPGNSLLGVSGDITPAAVMAKFEKVLGGWESGTAVEPKLAIEGPLNEKRVQLVNRPNSVQTYLMLTNRAIDRMNPDYEICQVLNRVLGSGPSSRLFRNIREEKGYTYGVYSNFRALKFTNVFSASGSVRTEVTGPAIDEFLKEFRDIRERTVPADELEGAKRAIVAGFALGLENQGSVLRQLMLLHEYGLPLNHWDNYPARIMAITAEDVQRAAKKYIPVDNLQLIAVGDAGKIREVLGKYGSVEEFTSEGAKVQR